MYFDLAAGAWMVSAVLRKRGLLSLTSYFQMTQVIDHFDYGLGSIDWWQTQGWPLIKVPHVLWSFLSRSNVRRYRDPPNFGSTISSPTSASMMALWLSIHAIPPNKIRLLSVSLVHDQRCGSTDAKRAANQVVLTISN